MMGYHGMGAAGWIWTLIAGVFVVVPFWRLLPRFAMPSWLALVAIFPLAALVLLWVMAFREPRNEKVDRWTDNSTTP